MKNFLLCLSLCGACSSALAQHSAFTYDSARALPPGTVLHFIKSGRDGARPWNLDLYVASPTRIDVVKWAPGASDFVEVAADFDLARATPTNLQQWNTLSSGREPRLYGNASADSMQIKLHNGAQFELKLSASPLHLWGFDLMGLAFLVPHLKDPEQAFELEVVDPNRPGSDGQPFAQGTARFEPVGFEDIDGARSRKYRISGPVFGEQTGWLWVNAQTGRIERGEHPIPSSTDWSDWKIDYTGSEQMDGLGWENFKLKLAQNLGGKGSAGRSLAADMQRVYAAGGLKSLLEGVDGWRAESAKGLENDLNTYAYTLLGQGKLDDALALFARIAQEFPQSANAWDSLGEAQREAGQKAAALASYRRALKLDPGNEHVREQIKQLSVGD